MARAKYMPAEARCRQMVRLIEKYPGCTLEQLATMVRIGYRATAAYVARLTREERIDVIVEEPATPNGCRKWLYPKGAAPAQKREEAA